MDQYLFCFFGRLEIMSLKGNIEYWYNELMKCLSHLVTNCLKLSMDSSFGWFTQFTVLCFSSSNSSLLIVDVLAISCHLIDPILHDSNGRHYPYNECTYYSKSQFNCCFQNKFIHIYAVYRQRVGALTNSTPFAPSHAQ